MNWSDACRPPDFLTSINKTIFRWAPKLSESLQWYYMAANQTVRPTRTFETFYGATMTGNIGDAVLKRVFYFGVFEPSLSRCVLDTIREGDTVVDIGANHGYFAMLMSRMVGPSGRVLAFEAFPDTYASLMRNLTTNDIRNVDARQVAVADRRGTLAMAVPWARNSGSATIAVEDSEMPQITVPGDTLMSLLGAAAERVSFIKIDIEGSERAPLLEIQANKDRFHRPLTIAVEVAAKNADLEQKFRDAGFSVRLLPHEYTWDFYLNGDERALDAYDPPARRVGKSNDYLFSI
jgi:FkbM family methyltransferase